METTGYSAAARAIAAGPRTSSHLLLLAVVAFVVVGAFWAAYATVDEVTVGEGRVIPSSHLQVIQSVDGGVIERILVREGEIVEKGQVLLRLDDTRSSSNYRENWLKFLELSMRVERLRAELDGHEFPVPEGVSAEAAQLAANEQDLFNSRRTEYESSLAILREQAEQRQQELNALVSREGRIERSYRLAVQELEITAPLVEEGVISQVELLRLKREVNDLKGELDGTRLDIQRARSAVTEAEGKMEEFGIAYRSETLAELNERQAELSRVEEVVRGAQDRVTRTTLASPVNGIVKRLNFNTVGAVLQPGESVAEVVPLEDSLLIEARIPPKDIAFLRPGQPAIVKFSAYDFSIYGGLEAKLEHISADSIFSQDGESYYLIRVRTDESGFSRGGELLPIIPGMTATVNILTGTKTVLDYLLKPILKARDAALRER